MVERAIELRRSYRRKEKMRKLKAKLGTAQGADREKILAKIHRLSPWWTEAGAKSSAAAADAPRVEEPKKKAPPRPKAEKKDKPAS